MCCCEFWNDCSHYTALKDASWHWIWQMKAGKAERTTEKFKGAVLKLYLKLYLLLDFLAIQINTFSLLLKLGFDLHFLLFATKRLLTHTWIFYGFCEDYGLTRCLVYKYWFKQHFSISALKINKCMMNIHYAMKYKTWCQVLGLHRLVRLDPYTQVHKLLTDIY